MQCNRCRNMTSSLMEHVPADKKYRTMVCQSCYRELVAAEGCGLPPARGSVPQTKVSPGIRAEILAARAKNPVGVVRDLPADEVASNPPQMVTPPVEPEDLTEFITPIEEDGEEVADA